MGSESERLSPILAPLPTAPFLLLQLGWVLSLHLDLLSLLFSKGKGPLCYFGGGPFPSPDLYTPPDSLTKSPILPLTVALPSSGTMG